MSQPLLPIDEARAIVRQVAGRRRGTETIPIAAALDRILADDVSAAGDVPRFPSSAMDGFAIRDLASGTLQVVGESRAGQPFAGQLAPGQAVRISTGAMVPAGAEAVIRQEDTTAADGQVHTHTASRPGQNVRMPGEDMRTGQPILRSGVRLRASELGAAVAAGAGKLTVALRPSVSILCTGDELRAPGAELGPGQIHNSNAPVLRALVIHGGAAPRSGGDGAAQTLPDDPSATDVALDQALAHSDVVIVSGGVSVGPHDHVKPSLLRLGVTEHFWGVALQPGKPTWFGSREDTMVFGLPGNPVSAVVTFSLFVRPALDALLGAIPELPPLPQARLGEDVRRNPDRDQALRVSLEMRDGVPFAVLTGAQDSHLFSSLLRADCLAIVPRGGGPLRRGEPVRLEALPV